jgi:hypothetical protein
MAADAEPCPGERDDPCWGVSAVADDELLIKIVEIRSLLTEDEQGRPRLTASAIKRDDLAGRDGRSVSTLRQGLTPHNEIQRRSKSINKEPAWVDDPLLATATTLDLRNLMDRASRREVCVHAEPTTIENDKLGACPTHAGIKRSCTPPETKSRLEWAVLRGAVAAKFREFRHAYSDESVTDGLIK